MQQIKQKITYQWIRKNFKIFEDWDWQAVGICFVTACTFWIFHSLNAEHTTNLELPIRLSYNQENLVLLNKPPETIQANVTGYGWTLLRKSLGIGLPDIAFDIEMHTVDFLTAKSMMPTLSKSIKELKINYILNDTVFFNIDTLVTYQVPIQVEEGDLPLARGVKLVSNIIASPNELIITGPASLLNLPTYRNTLGVVFLVDSIRDDFYGTTHVNLKEHEHLIFNKDVIVRFKVDYFLQTHARAQYKTLNFPRTAKITIIPDEGEVRYWLRQGSLMLTDGEPILHFDYRNINWEDSTIVPSVEISSKYLDPITVPSKFKLKIEH